MSFNVDRTLISQYAASPIVSTLIELMPQWLNTDANVDLFYNNIWNILTAVGYGLDVWGRILGFSRVVAVSIPNKYFGFTEGGTTDYDAFGAASFYSSQQTTQNVSLPDSTYRQCLMAKAAANIWNGSIPGLNAILLGLFPFRGACYVTDGPGRAMTYTFNFPLSVIEVAIVSSGLLPRPTGVAATVVVI